MGCARAAANARACDVRDLNFCQIQDGGALLGARAKVRFKVAKRSSALGSRRRGGADGSVGACACSGGLRNLSSPKRVAPLGVNRTAEARRGANPLLGLSGLRRRRAGGGRAQAVVDGGA
jgi:hypothetical protein